MAVSRTLMVGVAVLAVAVAGVTYYVVASFSDTTTYLKLEMSGQACAITTPINDKDVTVKKNKKVTWNIQNLCPSDQLVSVGNFRTQANDPGGVTNCKAGMAESTWPFKPQDQGRRAAYVPKDGGTDSIVLREAKNDTPDAAVYYFDICLGGVKKDPRLVVDPF